MYRYTNGKTIEKKVKMESIKIYFTDSAIHFFMGGTKKRTECSTDSLTIEDCYVLELSMQCFERHLKNFNLVATWCKEMKPREI